MVGVVKRCWSLASAAVVAGMMAIEMAGMGCVVADMVAREWYGVSVNVCQDSRGEVLLQCCFVSRANLFDALDREHKS